MTGYVMAPTPAQIADHIDRWEKLREAGVEGVPERPVEWQVGPTGEWVASTLTLAEWRKEHGQSTPRHGYRLPPLPSLPSSPETVVVVDANTAHALIGRSIRGEEIEQAWTTVHRFGFCDEDGDAITNLAWGSTVSLDPLPAPPPEEEVVTVREALAALHEAMQTYRWFRGDGSLAADAAHLARWMDENYDRLHAARAVLTAPRSRPLPPGAPEGAVWLTDETLAMLGQQVPRGFGWEWRYGPGWDWVSGNCIYAGVVEARPPQPPATERVRLDRARTRKLPGYDDRIEAIRCRVDGVWEWFAATGWLPLPLDADGMVEVIAP